MWVSSAVDWRGLEALVFHTLSQLPSWGFGPGLVLSLQKAEVDKDSYMWVSPFPDRCGRNRLHLAQGSGLIYRKAVQNRVLDVQS